MLWVGGLLPSGRTRVVHQRSLPTLSASVALSDHQAGENASPDGSMNSVVAWATIGIFLMLFGLALYLTRAVLIPFTAAVIIAMTLAPLGRRAARKHIPPWLFGVLIIVLLIAALHVSTLVFFAPISKWIERAPELAGVVKDKIHAIDSVLNNPWASIRGVPNTSVIDDGGLKIDLSAFIEPVLGFLTPAISQLIIFLAMLFFLLAGQAELRRNLILVFPNQEQRLRAIRILNDIEEDLARYVVTVTVINFVLGCLTAVGVSLIGLPNPVLWGTLAFLCNFVPYIGPAVVLCVLLGVGLINFPSVGQALIAPAFYVVLTTLEGHFITPNIVGKRFTLSPLVVFLALVFWTWLWGPVGGFLSLPLLMIIVIVFNHVFPEDEVTLPN
jgi:predicted PurR-regulated permease PerM